jgi:hypothetical protein
MLTRGAELDSSPERVAGVTGWGMPSLLSLNSPQEVLKQAVIAKRAATWHPGIACQATLDCFALLAMTALDFLKEALNKVSPRRIP